MAYTIQLDQEIQHNKMAKLSFKSIFITLLLFFVFLALSWLSFIRNVHAPLVVTEEEDFFLGRNEAQLSEKWSDLEELDIQDEGKFHMVTNIILFTHKVYSSNLLYDGERTPTQEHLEKRQREVEETLQKNLNNEHVAAVHILYFHPAISLYLTKLRLKNSKKMVLHLTRRDPTVAVNLDYIQKYLKNKFVILIHQDNYLGKGWDDVDFTHLRTNHLMYALTRHSVTEKYPCNAAIGASCNPGAIYLGSHDTFVFYSDRNFPKNMLLDLNIIPSSSGMENVLIWYFRKTLNYKVTNPCKHLIVYHNHCVSIREKGRKRYNLKNKNGLAQFTDKL